MVIAGVIVAQKGEKGRGRTKWMNGLSTNPLLSWRHRWRPEDVGLRERMRLLAGEQRRFGHRLRHVLLRQKGLVTNRKKTPRLFRED